jgi:hypothetical protein
MSREPESRMCADCRGYLRPDERERGLCIVCFADFLEHCAEDEQFERERDEER